MKTKSERHKFHKVIGEIIENHFKDSAILDKACGGNQNIPLFYSIEKSNETEFCNVDILVKQNDKIKILIEIDESNTKPTQLFGKFLTSALSKYFIHSNKVFRMSSRVLFMQIVSRKHLKDKSKKNAQWNNIKKAIQDILPLKNSNVQKYELIFAEKNNLTELKQKILKAINRF